MRSKPAERLSEADLRDWIRITKKLLAAPIGGNPWLVQRVLSELVSQFEEKIDARNEQRLREAKPEGGHVN